MTETENYIQIGILGSGSKGNSIAISSGSESILIDAGFSARELERRLNVEGMSIASVRAVLLTHEHSDHIQGGRVFCNRRKIAMYLSCRTGDYLADTGKLPEQLCLFEPGDTVGIGEFCCQPFSVRHDAADPVGFCIRHVSGARIGVATDLGELDNLAKARLSNCDVLVLESNYDRQMLVDSDRELRLKRRIMSRSGHLDNVAAAAGLRELVGARTKAVFLAHLSRECNRHELAMSLAHAALEAMGRTDVFLAAAGQDEPLEPFFLPVV
ncbi:MAG: MBL fold metallo-hydrolase [Victivallaceae bacterium]|nr:MBL fold metallo-hydrolase [Victivallaceae bacterium]